MGPPAGKAAPSPNLVIVRKLMLLLALGALALLPSAHAAAGRDGATLPPLPPLGAEENPLFAAGGTPVSNGIFFPGTILCAYSCDGEPYQIKRGTNIRLYNLDPALVANSHGMTSKDSKKKGGPLFQSETFGGPGSVLVKTSHLKPGTYEYFCRVHFGMQGLIEVVP
jgi:hypothetical protein